MVELQSEVSVSWIAKHCNPKYMGSLLRQIGVYSCTGCGEKEYFPKIFCSYISSGLEFWSKILHTYLIIPHTHNSLIIMQLAYNVIKLSSLQCCHQVIFAC